MNHAKLQEGLTWFHVVFCNDEGYSSAQLDVIDISARILTCSAVMEARKLGLDVGATEVDFEPRQGKDRLVMEVAWTLLSPETCTNDERSQACCFGGDVASNAARIFHKPFRALYRLPGLPDSRSRNSERGETLGRLR